MTGDKKISILAIDDEPSILRSLEGVLDDEGYRVLTAISGPEGLSILTREKVDAVLLDVWMPGMDGIETLEKIREKYPEISVILLTGHGNKEIAAKAFQLGASDFLSKPISLDNLLDLIEKVTKRKVTKEFRAKPGQLISAAFYETICIYPEDKDLLSYLWQFCRERYFKIVVALDWTDVLAVPSFVTILDPSRVRKKDWSILFDYLGEVPDSHEQFVLLGKAKPPTIPEDLRKFFKTTADKTTLGEYILHRNKEAVRRMTRNHRARFVNQRRKDVKKILDKEDLRREFLSWKLARYYNVSLPTIQSDLNEIT